MAMSPPQGRLSRSQFADNSPLSGPSSDTQIAGPFSRAGRRVLAELACNDSPIAGLLPAGTPDSYCKGTSGHGGPIRSRKNLRTDGLAPQSPGALAGESLLRSQVQSLLEKIECGIGTNEPGSAQFMPSKSGMVASPSMLAAFSPLNIPALAGIVQLPPSDPERESLQNNKVDALNELQILSTMAKEQPESLQEKYNAASGTDCVSTRAAGSASSSLPAPASLEAFYAPSSAEIFDGKRALNFDDDTPYKTSLDKGLCRALVQGAADCSSAMRQLEDDEMSEWSVNVNVGSPMDKECLIELSENTASGPIPSPDIEEDPLKLCEHVKMRQQVSSSKVQLLWDTDVERELFESEKDIKAQDDSRNSGFDGKIDYGCSVHVDKYVFPAQDDDCCGGGECDDLCDMFLDMAFGEKGPGLPKGEGRHIRFLYEDGDDEISEAMVVNGEEDALRSGTVMRFKGLPMPSGRHWRFVEDEE